MKDKFLEATEEVKLRREVVRLKTKLNMLRYFAYKRFHALQPDPALPKTKVEKTDHAAWEAIIRKLNE
jgi:hypothetical protein